MPGDNILSFPQDKIVRVPSAELLEKLKSQGTKNFADGFAEEIANILMMELNEGGLDCDDEAFSKDFYFLVGSVKALIYRSFELEHPLHVVIDQAIIEEGSDDSL
jgi:hypothetical protein